MPRTFSRGKRFTHTDLFTIFDHHLTDVEANAFAEEARHRFCLEPPLEEKDLLELIDQILGWIGGMRRLTSILERVTDPFVHRTELQIIEEVRNQMNATLQNLRRGVA